MSDAPERIVVWSNSAWQSWTRATGDSWLGHDVDDVEYVRADLYEAQAQALARLKATSDDSKKALIDCIHEQAQEIERLQEALAGAYAELRKLRPGLTAVFDREVHDRAALEQQPFDEDAAYSRVMGAALESKHE